MPEILVQFLSWEDPRRDLAHNPGKNTGVSHGQRSLAGYSPWGCKESDTIEQLHFLYTPTGLKVVISVYWIHEWLMMAHWLFHFFSFSLTISSKF